MVEYAALVAHNTASFFRNATNDASAWAGNLNWQAIGYGAVVLAFLWLAFWAFRPARF